MRPLNWLYLNTVLPLLQKSRNRGIGRYFREYSAMDRWSQEAVRTWQWGAVQKICRHAYESSPFYRSRFDSVGLRPEDLRSPADLQALPYLTREDIRQNLPDLWSRRFKEEELVEAATGGTTDTPVRLYRDAELLPRKNAVQWSLNAWANYLPGDRTFWLWGALSDYAQHPSWRWRIYERYVVRSHWAATSLFNAETLARHLRSWNELRPEVIVAYPTPLTLFCEFLRDTKAAFHRPRAVICTAESLLDDQRAVIREVLGVEPFEHYGSRDVGMVGAECEMHAGLHIHPGAIYLETVPLAGEESGGLQEMIVTDLINEGMPLIRYQTNDCTLPGPASCACGRNFPMITRVLGRTTDNFTLPNGDIVPGVSVTNRIIKVCPGIKKIQVIQERVDQFLINYVPTELHSPADLQTLDAKLREFLGASVHWRFEQVPEIAREKSGKTRYCISRVKPGSMRTPAVEVNALHGK